MADESTSATGDRAEATPDNIPLPPPATPAASAEQAPLFEERAPLDLPEVVVTPVAEPEDRGSDGVEREAEAADDMPEDLRELADRLDQPTGEMAAVVAEDEAPDTPEPAEPGAEEPAEAVSVPGDELEGQGAPESDETSAADAGGVAAAETAAEGGEAPEGEAATEAEPTAEGGAEVTAETATEAAVGGEAEAQIAVDEAVLPKTTVPWWPFIAYVVVWLGAAAYAVWQLQQLPAGQVAYETNLYTMSMLGGLILLAAGPVLIIIVWLASWIGRKGRRIGLMFISALVKGAAATLIGAVIWIGAILLTDYLRLGRPF